MYLPPTVLVPIPPCETLLLVKLATVVRYVTGRSQDLHTALEYTVTPLLLVMRAHGSKAPEGTQYVLEKSTEGPNHDQPAEALK